MSQFAPERLKSDSLRFDRAVWDAVVREMVGVGLNLIVIDVGEGMQFESHPELAVNGSWSPAELNAEVRRLRGFGIEAIPKLNFSSAHDAWLGEYAFMVSSQPYYRVCGDLIGELADVFERPELFHIGMDEETLAHQRRFSLAVVRQHELWYNDLRFLAGKAERSGSRPWMWADRIWHHRDEFLNNVPRTIVQSNWYYFDEFRFLDCPLESDSEPALSRTRVKAYDALEEGGFDQIPCGSTCKSAVNMDRTIEYCDSAVSPRRLLGYLTAPWYATVDRHRGRLVHAVQDLGRQLSGRRSRALATETRCEGRASGRGG